MTDYTKRFTSVGVDREMYKLDIYEDFSKITITCEEYVGFIRATG